MVLVQKWFFFQLFFVQAIQARKIYFTIFYIEKTPFWGIKTKSSKSRKTDIFPKGLTYGQFWSKNCRFSNFYFLFKIGQENVFYEIQEQKTPFQAIKTRNSKSRKIDIFPRGLAHGFAPKMAVFPRFFLSNVGQENVFFDILHQENAFKAYKNKKFKKSKN